MSFLKDLLESRQPVSEAKRGDLSSAVEKFMDANDLYSFEGSRGERNFEKLVQALGYRNTDAFFADNSGAYEALVEWIGSQRNSDWEDGLRIEEDEDDDN